MVERRHGHFCKNPTCTVFIPNSGFLVGRIKEFCSPKCRMAVHRAQQKGAHAMGRDEKFTKRAQTTLKQAEAEAQRLNHNYIGTEHLLLGLAADPEGIAGRVLRNAGVEVDDIRMRIETIVKPGNKPFVDAIHLTPRAQKVLELAVDEARQMQHDFIGTEHLLLGLIREGAGIGAGVLKAVGVNLAKTRQQVLSMLGQISGDNETPYNVTQQAQAVLDEYGHEPVTLAEIGALWRNDADLYRAMYARLQTEHTALMHAHATLLAKTGRM